MEQFTPQVSDSDVERIIKRDPPFEKQEEIRKIIRQLEVREAFRSRCGSPIYAYLTASRDMLRIRLGDARYAVCEAPQGAYLGLR